NRVRQTGVDTSNLLWVNDGRLGLYFVEFGAAPRASSVLYDRDYSAISGIKPALSDSAAEVTREALQAARKAGVMVSYDLNYRGKLWTPEKAQAVQEPLMEFVDVLITTEEDTGVVFKIKADGNTDDRDFQQISTDSYKEVAKRLQERFKFKAVVITLRENPLVWRNTWSSIA